ncbi:MAG: helix-turn-helix transcriptional regulator [Oscillospiraceae bacterium]|nr:helix-turn-helix transcriptional regulator [Oscillospiraceae bacterium]
MSIKKSVVLRIQRLCAEKQMTLNALANVSGVTPSTIYSVMNKDRKDIGIVLIKKICDGMEISIGEFFNDSIFYELEQELE